LNRKLANGATTNQTFDAAGHLTVLENLAASGATVNRFTYTYDGPGNRTKVIEIGTRTTWSYDKTYQLTREQRSGAVSFDVTYTYDGAGNRTVQINDGARTTYAYLCTCPVGRVNFRKDFTCESKSLAIGVFAVAA
jgi:YD repeat-containing protein